MHSGCYTNDFEPITVYHECKISNDEIIHSPSKGRMAILKIPTNLKEKNKEQNAINM